MSKQWDRIIVGAGAAGLMCAAVAGYRGQRVLVIDHANKPGKKILMSGGGRCNFTHLHSTPANFFSQNPHFCKSALSRYSPADFLELVERHGIEWVEKTPGQLFCKESAKDLLQMLLTECDWAGVQIEMNTRVEQVQQRAGSMQLKTSLGTLDCGQLVIASGGLSIPTMGASGFGYEIAKQFGLAVIEPRPALVPFTFTDKWKERLAALSGVSCDARVTAAGHSYREPLLFTHRGLSGPGALQVSSHWRDGQDIEISLMPGVEAAQQLLQARRQAPRQTLSSWLAGMVPGRLAEAFLQWAEVADVQLANLPNSQLEKLIEALIHWRLRPAGTEGWRTAEVTLGGVCTGQISQQNFSLKQLPELAFIGEVLDVTGELGGHNFQWAWASAVACGQA